MVQALGLNPNLTCLVLSSKIGSILFTTMRVRDSTYATSVCDRGSCMALWLVIGAGCRLVDYRVLWKQVPIRSRF